MLQHKHRLVKLCVRPDLRPFTACNCGSWRPRFTGLAGLTVKIVALSSPSVGDLTQFARVNRIYGVLQVFLDIVCFELRVILSYYCLSTCLKMAAMLRFP